MIAVTGAGGYLGGRLLAHLGPEARAIVRSMPPFLDGETGHCVDLGGPIEEIVRALEGCDSVVHLAGRNEVADAVDPDGALCDTITATRHLAAAISESSVRRVVFASTVHVYGRNLTPSTSIDEAVLPAPVAPYAIARLASEHLLSALSTRGIDVVTLRLTNAVGAPADPRVDRWSLVTNDLCREAATQGTVTLRSAGLQWRDFVAAADVDRALADAARGAIPPGTYNVGSGSSVTIRDAAELVSDRFEQLTGRRPRLVAPAPDGPARAAYRVDVRALRSVWETPDTPLESAIDEIARFCLDHRDEFDQSSAPTS